MLKLAEAVLTAVVLRVERLRALEPLVAPVRRLIVNPRFEFPHLIRGERFKAAGHCNILVKIGL